MQEDKQTLAQDYEIKVLQLDEALYEAGLEYLQQESLKYWTTEAE